MEKFEILVIGGGPAGITLAKMLGKKVKMAVIRPEENSMIYCAMPYAIEGLLPLKSTLKKDSLVIDSGSELIRARAEQVDFDKKTVSLSDSRVISYEKLVIATGANPIIPNIPGRHLQGVTAFKTRKDMDRIQNMISKGAQKAVVVGAGAIGIELAQALASKNLDVHLVDLENSLLPNMMDNNMTEDLLTEIKSLGITVHLNSKVTSLFGENQVLGVNLQSSDNSSEISFGKEGKGFVVFAVGMAAETALFKNTDLQIGDNGIRINSRMETNIKNVYAVGDCAQFNSGVTGTVISGKLATNAVPMAKILGFNLLGQKREYNGFYNGSATKIGSLFTGGTGISSKQAAKFGIDTVEGYSELTSKFPIMPGAEKINVKLIADKKDLTLIGAQVISKEPVTDKIDLLTFAIQKKTKIPELTGLSYSAQPWQSFFPAANLIVMGAEDILKKIYKGDK